MHFRQAQCFVMVVVVAWLAEKPVTVAMDETMKLCISYNW